MSSSPEPLNPARRRLTFLAMCIGQGMNLLDNTIVNVALPAIQRGPLRRELLQSSWHHASW